MTAPHTSTQIERTLIGLAIVALFQSCATDRQPQNRVPRFEIAACRFALAPGQREADTVSCGDLWVREDRAVPSSATLRLHVIRFHSAAAPDGPPTFFLAGGPALHLAPMVAQLTPARVAPLTTTGDFVLVNYRGVENSVPALECASLASQRTPEEQIHTVHACFTDYDTRGIALRTYNSQSVADDIAELRTALGYTQINVYGVSYGTRIALEIMRRHPHGVRAVVLDSPVPPEALWWAEEARHFEASYRGLFAACAADSACNASYPNLEAHLLDAVRASNDSPLAVTVAGTPVPIRGNDLIAILNQVLYVRDYYPLVPRVVDAAYRRDVDLLGQVFTSIVASAPRTAGAYGMNYAVWCNDYVQYAGDADIHQALNGVGPEVRAYFEGGSVAVTRAVCAQRAWKPADASDVQPITSPLPTLVLAGELDPVTPPVYGQAIAANLARGTLVVLPRTGHSSGNTACGASIGAAFLRSPDAVPDTACAAELKRLMFR